jgi:hypothetical protein
MISDPNTLLRECRSPLALRSGAAALFAIACFWPTITDAMLIKLFAAAIAARLSTRSTRRAGPVTRKAGQSASPAGPDSSERN